MGEFAAGTAAATGASPRIVLRSIPVLRLISCCETWFCSSVITVLLRCGDKTFTPGALLTWRGDHVLSPPQTAVADYSIGLPLLGDFEVAITGGIWVAAGA